MTRHEAREQAFMVLFEKIFNDDETVSEIIDSAEENDLIKLNAFSRGLLKTVEDNAESVDAAIESNSEGWSLQRLPKVSLAVMRLAVAEIKFCDDIPSGVAINEAVEITKKYGTPDDASYVNGVLGAVARAQ